MDYLVTLSSIPAEMAAVMDVLNGISESQPLSSCAGDELDLFQSVSIENLNDNQD